MTTAIQLIQGSSFFKDGVKISISKKNLIPFPTEVRKAIADFKKENKRRNRF